MEKRGIWLTLAGIAALAALVGLVPPLRDGVASALSGDAGELRLELLELGPAAVLVLVGLMLVHAIVPFPSELVNAAAGFVYGLWLGFPLVLAGWLVSALATYAIGRGAAWHLSHRALPPARLRPGGRLQDRQFAGSGFRAHREPLPDPGDLAGRRARPDAGDAGHGPQPGGRSRRSQ